MADATIYDKAGEHVLILNVRTAHFRGLQATDWTDLRVGFFLSVTRAAADDDPTTLTETITGSMATTDRFQLGLIDSATGSTFVGYSNIGQGRVVQPGNTMLVSSDIGIGTTNTRYWRPKNSINNSFAVVMIDGDHTRAVAGDGSQLHFVQDPTTANNGAAGYCTLFALRFTRPDPRGRAKIITMEVKKTALGHSSDILFGSDPSTTIIEAQLESFPTTVNTLGPVEMSQEPNMFYLYWPFHNSRLRIHSIGILKVA